MVDHATYSRYSRPLVQQMDAISKLGPAFLSSVESASRTVENSALVSAARRLISKLNGKPGEGALAVYRELDANINSTDRFIKEFKLTGTAEGRAVIAEAQRIQDALERMRMLVQDTPSEVMREIKTRLTENWGSPEEKYHSSVGTPVMYLVIVGILVARWLGVFQLAWWLVVPAAFFAGVVSAATVSTVIKVVRGY